LDKLRNKIILFFVISLIFITPILKIIQFSTKLYDFATRKSIAFSSCFLGLVLYDFVRNYTKKFAVAKIFIRFY
jgi:hypothetical protein